MSEEKKRKVLGLSSISTQYQTTIPQKVRDIMNLEDALLWILEDGKIFVKKP